MRSFNFKRCKDMNKSIYIFILVALLLMCNTASAESWNPDPAELDLNILNVQSYPTVGGNWTVMFKTVGTANLSITAVDGTTWSDTSGDYDLEFLKIKCGNQILDYEWIDDSIFIENYSCLETGYEISTVLSAGKHR